MSPRLVVTIHTKSGCAACKQLLTPKKYQEIVTNFEAIYSNLEVNVVNHPNWTSLNKTAQYPLFKKLDWAPMFTVTTMENSTRSGDPSKVLAFNAVWDPKTSSYTHTKNTVTIDEWAKENFAALGKTSTRVNPVNVEKLVDVVIVPGGKNKPISMTVPLPRTEDPTRKCHNFKLVQISK